MGVIINRHCYKCGFQYTYRVGEKDNEHFWRLCKNCHNDKSRPWKCACGEEFPSRGKLMEHRNSVKASGGWCGKFLDTRDLHCPICGKLISRAHEKKRPSECVRDHSCKGLKEFAQYGITMTSLDKILNRLKKCESTEYIEMPSDSALQYIWLQDRMGDALNKYPIRSIEANQSFLILAIPKLKMFFIFDIVNMLFGEKWEKALNIIGWRGMSIKWTDCILGKNDCESQAENMIRERINMIENTSTEEVNN